MRPAEPAPAPAATTASRPARSPKKDAGEDKEATRRRRRLKALEEKIAGLENEVETIETRLWEEALTLGPVAAHDLSRRKSGAEGGARRPRRGVGAAVRGSRGGRRTAASEPSHGAAPMSARRPGRRRSSPSAPRCSGRCGRTRTRSGSSARLEEAGIRVVRKSIVGDDPPALRDELDRAASAAPLVFTTGGLGPTADDVTVAAVAEWLGAPLGATRSSCRRCGERFERRGFPMPECNAKQADFIVGARVLANPRGTAPGFPRAEGRRRDRDPPGRPVRDEEIIETLVLPELRERAGGRIARRRVLRIAGMGESAVEELVAPVYAKWKEDPVTILASPGEVQLHLVARGTPDEAERKLAEMEEDFREVLGDRVFGQDTDDLAVVVGPPPGGEPADDRARGVVHGRPRLVAR